MIWKLAIDGIPPRVLIPRFKNAPKRHRYAKLTLEFFSCVERSANEREILAYISKFLHNDYVPVCIYHVDERISHETIFIRPDIDD